MEIINKKKEDYINNNSNTNSNNINIESSGDTDKNRGYLPSSTSSNSFIETGGNITDNEYEVTSETDLKNTTNINSRGIKLQ